MSKIQKITISGYDLYGNPVTKTVDIVVPSRWEKFIRAVKWQMLRPYKFYCLKGYGIYKFM